LARVYELDQNGNECCDEGGSSCPYNVGCNDHEMYVINNVFTTTITASPQESVMFTGSVEAPGDSQTQSCVVGSPQNYGICVPFVFTSTVINQTDQVMVGNEPFPLQKESIHAHVLISNWPFNGTSIGLRLKLLIMTENVNIQGFYLQPGDTEATNLAPETNTFTGVTLQDVKNNQGSLNISSYALVNGITTKVNISGLHPHDYDLNARYIFVDIPRGAQVEYDVNIYLPGVSGVETGVPPVSTPSSTFISENKIYFIIGGAVLGGILLCACIICVVIKLR